MIDVPISTSEYSLNQLTDAVKCLDELEQKYERLVWYARRDFRSLPGVPQEIIDGAKNASAQVEELYPDEIDSLKDPRRGDWTHGFNSGMLASIRFVLDALSPEEVHDDGDGEYIIGGLSYAKEAFPDLNT
jgi:hypothetical protein